ncbi:hypothetical protein C0J52_26065 [Blattella germanica]|nr:hypothetical protein C0J52_26065 [Blattella germanica]
MNVAIFKYLGTLITNRNEIQKEIKHRLNSGNACYYALQRHFLKEEEKRLQANNTGLNDLYGKPDTIRKIKSHRLRWARHVARMGDERGVRRILERKPEGKRLWENNINHDLRDVDYIGEDWKTLAQDRDVWRACIRTAMNLRVR